MEIKKTLIPLPYQFFDEYWKKIVFHFSHSFYLYLMLLLWLFLLVQTPLFSSSFVTWKDWVLPISKMKIIPPESSLFASLNVVLYICVNGIKWHPHCNRDGLGTVYVIWGNIEERIGPGLILAFSPTTPLRYTHPKLPFIFFSVFYSYGQ